MGSLLHLFRRQRIKPSQPREMQLTVSTREVTRRHLTDIPYAFPKDSQEEQRIDFQHYVLSHLLGKLYLAPISPNSDRILDVGSGTGRWSIEMAHLFPQAQVVGVDKEAPLHTLITRPPNYRFQSVNILNGFPFAENAFSFVHQRLLVGAIPAATWPFVLQECVRVVQPRGYVELVEGGNHYLNAGPATHQMVTWGTQASKMVGIDPSLMSHLDTMLAQAGLVHIHKQVIKAPVGKWGGRLGEMLATDMYAGFASLQDFYGVTLDLAPEDFQRVVTQLPEEWNQYQTAYELYVVFGSKKG